MTPAPKRRWLQFSLWNLFAITTIAAIIAGYPHMKVAERRWLIKDLKARGALVVTWHKGEEARKLPDVFRAAGAEPVQWMELPRGGFNWFYMSRIAGAFPEANIPGRPGVFWDLFYGMEHAR
jgi:hypothetical protein